MRPQIRADEIRDHKIKSNALFNMRRKHGTLDAAYRCAYNAL